MNAGELQKYLDIRRERGVNYGGFNHAKNHYPFLASVVSSVGSVCDLGCGTGKFPMWVKENFPGLRVFGVDPVFVDEGEASGVEFLRGDSTNIPLDKVDLLTSFDVMEHIHPDDLEASMREITRVSDFYIAKIAFAPSRGRGVNGEELHPLVRSKDWWLDHLGRWYGSVTFSENLFLCRS
jgi:SAM-dependent methyltransferase